MNQHKRKPARTFPVEDGSGPAPREDRIAGIVERVWADSTLYHEDVEPLLREWLRTEGYSVGPEEFDALLSRAESAFADATSDRDEHENPFCNPRDLVDRLYSDVEQLERTRSASPDTPA